MRNASLRKSGQPYCRRLSNKCIAASTADWADERTPIMLKQAEEALQKNFYTASSAEKLLLFKSYVKEVFMQSETLFPMREGRAPAIRSRAASLKIRYCSELAIR